MDGDSLNFKQYETVKIWFKSLTEQTLAIASEAQLNAFDIATLQDLYDKHIVVCDSINDRQSQNINIDTTFGNENSTTINITTYTFLAGSKLYYNRTIPIDTESSTEVVNYNTLLNFANQFKSNNGFYSVYGNSYYNMDIIINDLFTDNYYSYYSYYSNGYQYNFIDTFFAWDHDTLSMQCIVPCILFGTFISNNDLKINIQEHTASIFTSKFNLTSGANLPFCIPMNIDDRIQFEWIGTSCSLAVSVFNQ